MYKRFLLLDQFLRLVPSSVATAQSEMQQLPVPTIAPDFRAPQKPLPELTRVGVDHESAASARRCVKRLSMALENNKDIEVARENVRIAEFDLLGAQGVYDPRLSHAGFLRARRESDLQFLSGWTKRIDHSPAITPARCDSKDSRRFSAVVIVSTSRR